jgi:hypothetical protein
MYFREETLEDMLIHFRKNNEAWQITGMMLFSEGTFLQVLKGEDKDIDALVKKIKKDQRHHSVIQLETKKIETRIFPKWSMGFKVASPEEFKEVKGFANPADPNSFPAGKGELHPAMNLLKSFAAGMTAYR